jgi:hypothetical protein
MANYLVEHTATIADVDGQLATTRFRVRVADTVTLAVLNTTQASFLTAVAAMTNGKVVQSSVSALLDRAQILPGSTPPTDAVYPNVTDGARLNFASADGSVGHITIPAPTETTFLAAPNRDFVDPAGDASGLIAFLKTNMSDAGGTFLNLYQGGIKTGKSARRRRSPRPGLS